MPRFDSLPAWLAWQETLHPEKIDPGLERVAAVAGRLGLLAPGYCVITVAGTNGKGSSVALLDAILRAAGYRVGCYTSPHIRRYNERIQINGTPVSDSALCAAFETVDRARNGQTLSYFEFGTLAALQLFSEQTPDIAVLEVGMGGRLDAVNVLAADIALVTSISIDHSAWLGNDREAIGREKAGIFRPDRPAICSDPQPPASLQQHARALGARWYSLGQAFSYTVGENRWHWQGVHSHQPDLPLPALPGSHQLNNAAGVLMAVEALAEQFPVGRAAIVDGLEDVALEGRCQLVPGAVETVFDVAHNPDSARRLGQLLAERPVRGRTRLVLGMLRDKDAAEFAAALVPAVDRWYLAAPASDRSLPVAELQAQIVALAPAVALGCYPDVATALRQAQADAAAGDRVVVCGSFYTVAEALSVV
jgi:dihydrofolate synthase/folylpolyglutamate synthase